VAYCHSKKVCHRDLKPENMLLDKTGNKVKLIDFGLAAFFDKERKLTEVCGSKRFQAPEVYRKPSGSSGSSKSAGYEGPPVDIWSLGVVLFELVHGQIRMSGSDASLTTVQVSLLPSAEKNSSLIVTPEGAVTGRIVYCSHVAAAAQFIENALKKHLKDKTFSPELVQLLRGVLQVRRAHPYSCLVAACAAQHEALNCRRCSLNRGAGRRSGTFSLTRG
jgi:serine/threonine protein kinase